MSTSSSSIGTVVCTSMLPVSSSASIQCQVAAPFGVAIAERPGERDRTAMARQQSAGCMIDRTEARHVESRLRDLPGKAPADRQVGLVGAQKPLDRHLSRAKRTSTPGGAVDTVEPEQLRWLVALGAVRAARPARVRAREAPQPEHRRSAESCKSPRCARTRPPRELTRESRFRGTADTRLLAHSERAE